MGRYAKYSDSYNVHLLDLKRYGEIVNSFYSMDNAIAFANEQKKKSGNDYAVVLGSLSTVYSTVKS